METHTLRQNADGNRALKPSLEGWKHDGVPLEDVGCQDLETFLRGMETWN